MRIAVEIPDAHPHGAVSCRFATQLFLAGLPGARIREVILRPTLGSSLTLMGLLIESDGFKTVDT